MKAFYETYQDYYYEQINEKLKEFTFDLIVYDESEYFRDIDDAEFDYPYTRRKSVLQSFKVQLPDNKRNVEGKVRDYEYNYDVVKF